MRVAIVVMPWFDVTTAALGAGLLKAYLAPRGIRCDVLHLNLLMAERVGGLAQILADSTKSVWPEWFFGYHLFGPGGLGEVRTSLADAAKTRTFQEFIARSNLSLERLEALVDADVPEFLDECLESVDWSRYDAIGFSSIMASHSACLALARLLKRRFPDKPLILGGSNVESEMGPAALEACDWLDYVVSGEGEKALTRLLENIRDGRPHEPVPGVSLRGADGRVATTPAGPPIDMDELPTPDFTEYFGTLASSPVGAWISPRIIPFESSRGCWWGAKQHCTFCGLNGEVMTMRVRSAPRVLEDIVALEKRHGSLDLLATDNIIALEHMKTLMPELKRLRLESGIDYSFFYNVKSNLTEEQIALLAQAAVDRLEPGIESMDSGVLKLMRKGVKGIHNIQTLKFATEQGMTVYWNYLCGFPGEDPAAYGPMAEQALALTHLAPPIGVHPIRPDRFSPYHERPAEFGIEKPRPVEAYRHIFPSERFDLGRTAFYHDFAPRPGDDAPARYAAPLSVNVDAWRRVFATTFFAYRQGHGFVDLYDSRPRKADARPALGVARLEGFDAFIFRHFRSFSPVSRLEKAAREAGVWPGEAVARERLDALVADRVLAREDDLYLTLAVPLARLQERQKSALEQLLGVHHEWYRDRVRTGPRPERFAWT